MKKIILIIILMIGGIIMKAIKKVEVVPLDYNIGKIINSASSSDDKTKNTYSMKIIDDKISETIDYVDETVTNLETVQTFTETVVDDRNSNRYIDICWKKVGKTVQINIVATIPANGSSSMGMAHFNFTIPEWAKVSSNYTNVTFGENIYLISAIRNFIADSNGVQRGVSFNLLYNYSTNTQYIYGSVMNLTSNEAVVQGSITYILD